MPTRSHELALTPAPADVPALTKVLITVDAVGGVWSYALELSRGLAARGVQVVLAAMGPSPSPAQLAAAARVQAIVEARPFRLEWMDDPWDEVDRAGEWLLEVEARWQPEVIHLNGYVHAALPWRGAVVIAAHSCVCSWWRAVHAAAAPRRYDTYRRRVAAGLRAAAVVIGPSRAMLEALQYEHGPLRRTVVIPNAMVHPTAAVAAKAPVVLAAGRVWDEAKGLDTLCAAAPSLPWPVYVAGDAQLGTGAAVTLPNVTHLGRLEPDVLQEWLARAALYVLPARYEPFGLSVLEAAHAGCALVLGDIASLRENWSGAAMFVPPGDAAALSTAVRHLITHADERSALAASAIERARGFSVQRMTDAYLGAYAGAQARSASRHQGTAAQTVGAGA